MRIPNRQAALRRVAAHAAALLESGDLEEAAGVLADDMTPAEIARLEDAVDEVIRRLRAMGEPRRGGEQP